MFTRTAGPDHWEKPAPPLCIFGKCGGGSGSPSPPQVAISLSRCDMTTRECEGQVGIPGHLKLAEAWVHVGK